MDDGERLKMRKLVFVDESGNPGIKDEQGEFVIVGVVIVNEDDLARISEEFLNIRKQMSLGVDFEFKFSKTDKRVIMKLLNSISDVHFEVYALIFSKREIQTNGQTIYNRLLCDLIKEMKIENADILVDGKTSRRNKNSVASFFRKELSVMGNKLRYGNSKSFDGLQLADLVAGTMHRFYANKRGGADFMTLIKHKIRLIFRK